MKYFLMNQSYEWIFVDKFTYESPPNNMINNTACVNPDGMVSIAVANISQYDLRELIKLLKV